MSSDDEDYSSINPAAHKKLLTEINEIVKFQHIKKPKRNEPALKHSEFHLVKSKRNFSDDEEEKSKPGLGVSISSVAKTVQKNTKQKQIGNQLKNVFKNENVLVKPLEKVYAERIQRTIAYDSTKEKLGRWDAVVTKNQNAEQLRFPLVLEKTKIKDKSSDVPQFRYKTKLMKEMEEIHNECFPKPLEENKKVKDEPELLTLEEMKERRKELGRLKLRESNKIAKKRMQGKIKSKKYHKLKKREELKQKMKEFEELKVTNPELALKELEKIEKQRVRERTTLRHKNTGTWAKNLQVRAKYDANVKQDLEAQLALGRELTQKQHQSESSDSEEDEMVNVVTKSENPWLKSQGAEDPLDDVFSGYKKFWEDHNSTQNQVAKHKKDVKKVRKEKEVLVEAVLEEDAQKSDLSAGEDSEAESESDVENSKFINDLFDEAEEKINSKMEAKLSKLKPHLIEGDGKKQKKRDKRKKQVADVRDANYLGFAKKAKLGDVDAALNEGNESEDDAGAQKRSKSLLQEVKQRKEDRKKMYKGDEINPNSFLNVKSKHLITAVPRSQQYDEAENEYDVNQLSLANKMSLAEAFENDDIINDFEEEVESEFKKVNHVEDSALPGWGNWGGYGMKARKHKLAKKIPEIKKKDRVIISDVTNEKIKKHLISSVPFPFKSVEDFEASMRLPIGRDFVPESAHRQLVMPSIVTKAGTIIEPMSEDILVTKAPEDGIERKKSKSSKYSKSKLSKRPKGRKMKK